MQRVIAESYPTSDEMRRFAVDRRVHQLHLDASESVSPTVSAAHIMAIIFLPCDFYLLSIFYLLLFSPRLISAAADWMSTILLHMAWPYSANVESRSEMCCSRLAANTGRKKVAKNRHLGTIAQLRRAMSSQLILYVLST